MDFFLSMLTLASLATFQSAAAYKYKIFTVATTSDFSPEQCRYRNEQVAKTEIDRSGIFKTGYC